MTCGKTKPSVIVSFWQPSNQEGSDSNTKGLGLERVTACGLEQQVQEKHEETMGVFSMCRSWLEHRVNLYQGGPVTSDFNLIFLLPAQHIL